MELAVTANELANNTAFVVFAPIGLVLLVVILILLGKGDIDL